MQAELKIAGLEEIIQQAVRRSLKEAVDDVLRQVLEEFKAEMVGITSDSVLKMRIWSKHEILAYAKIGESTFWTKVVKCEDFPKRLNNVQGKGKAKALWDRNEVLKFFARHPEFPTTAKKDLEAIRRANG